MYVAIKSIARKRAPTILPKIYAALVGATLVAIAVGCRGPPQPGQGDAWSLHQILVTGTGNYIYKFIVAILLTPVIYLVHAWIEKYLGKNLASEMKNTAMKAEG